MRKIGIGLIVCLLAVAGIMAVMAYSNAVVDNDAQLKIVNSSKALLALTTNPRHNAAFVGYDGVMELNLNLGKDKAVFGLQARSEYCWDELFTVTNNSEKDLKVTIDLKNFPYTPHVWARTSKDTDEWSKFKGHLLNNSDSNGLYEYTFDLASGDSVGINMRVTVGNPGMGNKTGILTVSAAEKSPQ